MPLNTEEMPHAPAPTAVKRAFETLATPVYLFSLAVAALSWGGWAVLRFVDIVPTSDLIRPAATGAVATLVAVGSGIVLAQRDRRQLLFRTVLFVSMGLVTVYGANALAALFSPRWPAIGLHGVSPRVGHVEWAHASGSPGIGFNSWGQRDRERSLAPAAGTFRAAFIGDSFLEESETPVSIRTEEWLGGRQVEIINLGVSASGPDEYFYRTKNIALPLGAHRVFIFVYAGNDFGQTATMKSIRGVAATYPRDSLLSVLHLKALNHVLMNRTRPVLVAWFGAEELGRTEAVRAAQMAGTDDAMRAELASWVPARRRARLAAVLSRPEARPFLEMLRHPDGNRFRSYLVDGALRSADGEREETPRVDEAPAFEWVRRAAALCARRNAGFTLVVVPEAFQVDPRMQAQFAPVADMKRLYRPRQDAAVRLVTRARAAGIDTLDLFPVLNGAAGAYLNLDGHWSPRGVEIVSKVLASKVAAESPVRP